MRSMTDEGDRAIGRRKTPVFRRAMARWLRRESTVFQHAADPRIAIAVTLHVEHTEPSRFARPLIRPAPPATFPRKGGKGRAFRFGRPLPDGAFSNSPTVSAASIAVAPIAPLFRRRVAASARRHAKSRAAPRCSAISAARSRPMTAPSTTRHAPFTITRSARCAPQRTSAASGSWAPEKRGSSSV